MSINWKRLLFAAAVAGLLTIVVQPTMAEDERFAIRFGLVGMFPSTNTTVTDGMGGSAKIEMDDAYGGEFDFEWYFLKRFGLEASIATGVDADFDFDDSSGDDITTGSGMTMTPLTVGVNWHAIRSESVDWYIGVVAGKIGYSNWDFRNANDMTTSNVETDDDTTYGLQTAVDLSVTKSNKWAINVGLKYLKAEVDANILDGATTRTAKIDIDPWLLRVMGVFRF